MIPLVVGSFLGDADDVDHVESSLIGDRAVGIDTCWRIWWLPPICLFTKAWILFDGFCILDFRTAASIESSSLLESLILSFFDAVVKIAVAFDNGNVGGLGKFLSGDLVL